MTDYFAPVESTSAKTNWRSSLMVKISLLDGRRDAVREVSRPCVVIAFHLVASARQCLAVLNRRMLTRSVGLVSMGIRSNGFELNMER